MKQGAGVINCARGGIINEEAAGRRAESRAISPAPRSTSSCRSRRRPIIRLLKLPERRARRRTWAPRRVEAQDAVALEAAQLLDRFS